MIATTKTINPVSRRALREHVKGFYDIQMLRIAMGNRICANFHARLGREPGQKAEELDAEAQGLLQSLIQQWEKITDGIVDTRIRSMKFELGGKQIIADRAEIEMVRAYIKMVDVETSEMKVIKFYTENHPLWPAFLQEVKGVGPTMAGVILSEIDIAKCRYVSSLWKYAGVDVGPDGAGRSRKSEHLVDQTYLDKEGREATKKGITFNPFLKTKLCGVLADQFNRRPADGYGKMLRDYKHRIENHPNHQDKTKGHRQNMAKRYAVKMFLRDLYLAWRPLEGLPTEPDYHEAKLGHTHSAA